MGRIKNILIELEGQFSEQIQREPTRNELNILFEIYTHKMQNSKSNDLYYDVVKEYQEEFMEHQ